MSDGKHLGMYLVERVSYAYDVCCTSPTSRVETALRTLYHYAARHVDDPHVLEHTADLDHAVGARDLRHVVTGLFGNNEGGVEPLLARLAISLIDDDVREVLVTSPVVALDQGDTQTVLAGRIP